MNLKKPQILILLLLFISCNQDEILTNKNHEVEKLKSEIKKDVDFNYIISENIDFSIIIKEKLHDKVLLKKFANNSFLSKNLEPKQVLVSLGMDKIFENHLHKINQRILAIKNRYPNINILKPEDLSTI